jgi:hypothetical protein
MNTLLRTLPPILGTCLLSVYVTAGAYAANLYVSGTGSDTNNGKTAASAFRTLKKAATLVEPGDTVLIGDGTYSDVDTAGGSAVLTLSKSGRPDAWITWKAQPGQRPVIRPSGWQGIAIRTSYQVLDGLTVIGNNDSITLIDALKDAQEPKPNPRFNTNGITVEGRQNAPDAKPHHIIIRNCEVANVPEAALPFWKPIMSRSRTARSTRMPGTPATAVPASPR